MMPSAQAPLPPLPSVPTQSGGSSPQMAGSQGMEAIIAGLTPIKASVDAILGACRTIVGSGIVPGAEAPCGQIVALALSLLPAAAQAAMNPMGGGAPGGGMGGQGGGLPPSVGM